MKDSEPAEGSSDGAASNAIHLHPQPRPNSEGYCKGTSALKIELGSNDKSEVDDGTATNNKSRHKSPIAPVRVKGANIAKERKARLVLSIISWAPAYENKYREALSFHL